MTKKEVNLYDRLLCFLLAAAVSSAFILCSFSRPLVACALGEADTIASDIRNFYNDTKRELDRVERAVATDINNGNLDASSELYSEYMSSLALQYAMVSSPNFSTLVSLANSYNDGAAEAQKFLDYLNNNPTTTFSGSGSSGIYRSALDGKIHSVTLLPGLAPGEYRDFTATCAVSDEFEFTVTYTQEATWNRNVIVTDSYVRDCRSSVSWNNVWLWGDVSIVANNYFYGYNGTIDNNSQGMSPCVLNSASLPDSWVLERARNYNPITTPNVLGYSCVDVSLPSASVDTSEPWNYYNNTLLPYMQEAYPEVTNNYYIFPNGYGGPSQDPTEPSLPNGGINVYNDWNFNIGFNTIIATDASGQPVTDASGETVTETVIETETRPTDAVYHFQIPTLTPLDTQTATIPPYQVPAEYAGYMGNMFTAITDFIDDAGLTDVAPVFLALAGIAIVIGVLL